MTAWLLAATLPLLQAPARLHGKDPRFGRTCAAAQTVYVAVDGLDLDVTAAASGLRLQIGQNRGAGAALRRTDAVVRRETTIVAEVHETLTVPELIDADPPALKGGDRMGEVFTPVLQPAQDEIDALRRYADAIRRAPNLPHADDAAGVLVAHSQFEGAMRTAIGRFLRVCGFSRR
ncbi:MAG TPA: hypothetical protein VMD91_10935 [Candidatus Sulfotelmatobacter sp.]|nr:hypothetical protein [Candidatus Sulfotelmatobacter sp.]